MVKINIFVECINEEAELQIKEAYYEDLSIKETFDFKLKRVTFEKKVIRQEPFIFQLTINHPHNSPLDEKYFKEAVKQAITKEIVKKGIYDTDFIVRVNIDG